MVDVREDRQQAELLQRRLDLVETLGRLMVEARDSSDLREQIVLAFQAGVKCQRGSLWEQTSEGGDFVAQTEIRPPGDGMPLVVGLHLADPTPLLRQRPELPMRTRTGADIGQSDVVDWLGPEIHKSYSPSSMMIVPLSQFTKMIGFLLLDQPLAQIGFQPEELEIVEHASVFAAQLLLSMHSRIDEEARADRMTALARLSATLTMRHSLQDVQHEIVRHGAALARSDTCTLLLVDDDGKRLRLAAQVGLPETGQVISIPMSDPLVRQFVDSDSPLIVEDIDRDLPELRRLLVRTDIKSIHLFPLRVGSSVIGVLTLSYAGRHRSERSELNLSESLASVAAGAIQNARAFELEVEQRNLLRTVAEISRRVSGILDPDWMLQEVCPLLASELGYDSVHALLTDGSPETLVYAAGSTGGAADESLEGNLFQIDDTSLIGRAVKTGDPQVVGEASPGMFHNDREQPYQSELVLPIASHHRVTGVLCAQSHRRQAFKREDERLLKIVVDQISVALDNARHHAEVQAQAQLDSLTQVLNHGAFVNRVHELVVSTRAEGEPLSLIMLDVDEFKAYNDRFGHVAGDAALKTTVQAIRANVKSRDAVGRWGGEEFGVALVGADKQQAIGVADRIRQTLASLVPVDRLGREMPPPSVSQGIALLDEDASDADELVDVADRALYRAKAAGRDKVRVAGAD